MDASPEDPRIVLRLQLHELQILASSLELAGPLLRQRDQLLLQVQELRNIIEWQTPALVKLKPLLMREHVTDAAEAKRLLMDPHSPFFWHAVQHVKLPRGFVKQFEEELLWSWSEEKFCWAFWLAYVGEHGIRDSFFETVANRISDGSISSDANLGEILRALIASAGRRRSSGQNANSEGELALVVFDKISKMARRSIKGRDKRKLLDLCPQAITRRQCFALLQGVQTAEIREKRCKKWLRRMGGAMAEALMEKGERLAIGNPAGALLWLEKRGLVSRARLDKYVMKRVKRISAVARPELRLGFLLDEINCAPYKRASAHAADFVCSLCFQAARTHHPGLNEHSITFLAPFVNLVHTYRAGDLPRTAALQAIDQEATLRPTELAMMVGIADVFREPWLMASLQNLFAKQNHLLGIAPSIFFSVREAGLSVELPASVRTLWNPKARPSVDNELWLLLLSCDTEPLNSRLWPAMVRRLIRLMRRFAFEDPEIRACVLTILRRFAGTDHFVAERLFLAKQVWGKEAPRLSVISAVLDFVQVVCVSRPGLLLG